MAAATEQSPLAFERRGRVALLQLQRPEARNALSNELLEQLAARLAEVDADPGLRCAVIAGSDKVFASGADVRALAAQEPSEVYFGRRFQLWDRLRRVHTPLVAAVSGFCLGGGFELALTCDLLVASDSARFGLPETGLGLIPGAGGTQRLTRALGKARAMDVILSGRLLDAAEADAAGLVSRRAGEDWLATALALAAEVAERAPLAQKLAKRAVGAAFEGSLESGLAQERAAFTLAFASPEAKEGIAAFLEKRSPAWLDKD
ncbi:MAG TPA: enoyl-CoA hydratase-related protein [Solirubrobacterales bacterium]|nr:enoyl-CoA hydratase-related protein [Solirubrobacterales bacterium]